MTEASLNEDSRARNLCRVGAVAALLAALVFRRNLAAEMAMFFGAAPKTGADWFVLLRSNGLLGVISLNFFDVIDYALVCIMFLGLFAALKKTNRILAGSAAAICLAGVFVYAFSDTSFRIISLSNQYANAANDMQKTALLATAQEVLAKGIPGAGYQGTGGTLSMFLIAAAGLVMSVALLRTRGFYWATGYVGIVASAFDFAYLASLNIIPAANNEVWSSVFVGGAGLLLMIWHLLVGIKLYNLGRLRVNGGGNQ